MKVLWQSLRPEVVGLCLAVAGSAACASPTVTRDLKTTKPGTVVFDDMCGLQAYFDDLTDSTIAKPRELFSQDIGKVDSEKALGGTARYRFETEFQLVHLRQLLQANWDHLPSELAKASAVDLEVHWAEKAGVKRVVTTEDATLAIDNKSWSLPYQVCLSDLLFGEQLYETRRTVLRLPPPPPSRFSKRGAAGSATDPMAALTAATAAAAATAAGSATTPPVETASPIVTSNVTSAAPIIAPSAVAPPSSAPPASVAPPAAPAVPGTAPTAAAPGSAARTPAPAASAPTTPVPDSAGAVQ